MPTKERENSSEESNETSEESNHKSEEFAISSGANQKYPPSYLEIPREKLEQAHFYNASVLTLTSNLQKLYLCEPSSST